MEQGPALDDVYKTAAKKYQTSLRQLQHAEKEKEQALDDLIKSKNSRIYEAETSEAIDQQS